MSKQNSSTEELAGKDQANTKQHQPIVYLNGEFLPIGEAKVSVMDRGFLFGDGVYEVMPIYNGKPFRLNEHLARLQHSLDSIKLPLKVDAINFAEIFGKLLTYNNENFTTGESTSVIPASGSTAGLTVSQDYSVYIQITRGVVFERRHSFPTTPVAPTIFALIKPIHPLSYEELNRGKAAITAPDIRWKYCHIKSISLLPSVLLFQQAVEAGCDETILLRNGYVIEGTSSNVFIVNDGIIITPPLSQESLSGVTRDLILRIMRENNFAFKERRIKTKELLHADEVWISSSTRSIFPIVRLNGEIVGSGKAGPIWQKIIKLYLAYKEKIVHE